MSEKEETAKAVQETAKLGQDVINNLPEIKKIGKAILGPVGEGWLLLTELSSHGREYVMWRIRNRARIYRLTKEKIVDIGLTLDDTRPVSERIAYQYEDGLEHEDDPALQELWANLLVNATKPNSSVNAHRRYKETLTSMEPTHGQLFQFLTGFPGLESFWIEFDSIVDKGRYFQELDEYKLNIKDPGNHNALLVFKLESPRYDTDEEGLKLITNYISPYVRHHSGEGLVASTDSRGRAKMFSGRKPFVLGESNYVWVSLDWTVLESRRALDGLSAMGLVKSRDYLANWFRNSGRYRAVPTADGTTEDLRTSDPVTNLEREVGYLETFEAFSITDYGCEFSEAVEEPRGSMEDG